MSHTLPEDACAYYTYKRGDVWNRKGLEGCKKVSLFPISWPFAAPNHRRRLDSYYCLAVWCLPFASAAPEEPLQVCAPQHRVYFCSCYRRYRYYRQPSPRAPGGIRREGPRGFGTRNFEPRAG